VKLDAAVLIGIEERLARGEIPEGALPVLLEAVRHLLRCCFRRDSCASSTERRGKRRGRQGKKKGHGRHGAEDYPGAERVEVRHGELAPGGPCPEEGCKGRLYDTKAPAKDVVLKATPPVQATAYECQVLRCGSCQATFTAPLPSGVAPTKYDPSVDAVLSVMRYALGMPHHRLAQWQAWAGVPLPASSQFERVEGMANAVLPIFRHLEKLAADRPLLQSDDTGARILSLQAENRTRGPSERTGIYTTGVVARGLDDFSPPIVLYASGRRHAGENVDRLLRLRQAGMAEPIHMADASSMAPRAKRINANCNTHARRYFFEASAAFPEQCAKVLDDFAAIYQNDEATRGMTPQARLEYHQEHSRPVMDALYLWVEEQFAERLVEPNSRLGRAFSYLKNHWSGLTRFLEVPGVPLDNNETERELKPAQRHRKNSLFFLNEAGAAVGDVLLSVIRTCTTNTVDPVRYLTAVATHARAVARIPEAWLPWTYPRSPTALN
jgi:transposase